MSPSEVTPGLQDPSMTGNNWRNSLAYLAGVEREISAFDERDISSLGARMLPPLSAITCVFGAILAAAQCPVMNSSEVPAVDTLIRDALCSPRQQFPAISHGQPSPSPQQSTASP